MMSHTVAGIENRCWHSSPSHENVHPVHGRAQRFRTRAKEFHGHRQEHSQRERGSHTNFIDTLVARACMLAPDDRDLLIAVYSKNVSCAAIARAGGHDPRLMRRRLARLTRRVMSPTFALCASAVLAKNAGGWSPTRRAVGERIILQGVTYRAAATELKLSIHTIRAHVTAIRALASGVVQ